MSNPNNKSGVFNRCALEQKSIDGRYTESQMEECARQILSVIPPILESGDPLKCSPQNTWTLETFWPRSGISYATDVAGFRIEIADMEPREHDLPRGRTVKMERIVSIFPTGQDPQQAGTVFFYLHPHKTPELFVMTGARRDDGTFNCRQYAYKGDQRDLVKDALHELTNRIEQSIPLPPWAENFDKCYVIRGYELLAKRDAGVAHNRLH